MLPGFYIIEKLVISVVIFLKQITSIQIRAVNSIPLRRDFFGPVGVQFKRASVLQATLYLRTHGIFEVYFSPLKRKELGRICSALKITLLVNNIRLILGPQYMGAQVQFIKQITNLRVEQPSDGSMSSKRLVMTTAEEEPPTHSRSIWADHCGRTSSHDRSSSPQTDKVISSKE